jgi:tRNA (mo5U34)-methyltransferase
VTTLRSPDMSASTTDGTAPAATTAERAALADRVASIDWYHTLELAPGVVTPGWLDHRGIVPRIPLPASLEGKRCLDIGTFNGFWAFELERRGASEVIGIDVLDPRKWDWPVASDDLAVTTLAQRMAGGDGFEIARAALGSRVQRLDQSVYDLDEQEVGRFDVIYLGSLLVHLRDPVRALERVRAVCDGTLIVVDGIDLPLSLRSPRLPLARLDGRGRPWWWYANLAGLARLLEAAGFELAEPPRRLFVPTGRGWQPDRFNARALSSHEGRYQLIAAWLGDPHGIIVARPRR